MYRLPVHHRLRITTPLPWVAVTKFKTTNMALNSRTFHENCPPHPKKLPAKQYNSCPSCMFYMAVGLKEFLEESEAKLQTVFDSACGFWNIHGFLLNQIECRINDVASMRITAGKLLNTTIDVGSTGTINYTINSCCTKCWLNFTIINKHATNQ